MAKSVRITFNKNKSKQALTDVSFHLSDGIIIKEDKQLSDAFLRYEGWSGADGIFSFDMENGGDQIGIDHETTGFIFSDTFVGEVYPHNKLRKSGVIINNSFGYLSHLNSFDRNQFTFDYKTNNGKAGAVIIPNELLGSRARNLLDSDGLTASYDKSGLLTNKNEGVMWLSNQINNELLIDLATPQEITEIVLWNFNETSSYGLKSFNLKGSFDGQTYEFIKQFEINRASGEANEPFTLSIDLGNKVFQFLKIEILASHHQDFVGLGKILILGTNDTPLFAKITALQEIRTLTEHEMTSRYWLQDGVILNEKLYVFPILVKDLDTIFKVHHVSMVEVPIKNQRFDYEQAIYHSSPLMSYTPDGGVIYYGAGLMDHTHLDGYVYIYGYKDLAGRGLIVGRFKPEDIYNFNKWTYYDGTSWSKNINDSFPLIDKVSAELSVTYLNKGMFKNKYMLVVMEDTTSGTISYSLSDTPYGPFSSYTQVYKTLEATYLKDAFTYNAKMHPNLSEDGNLVISYNVNTRSLGALSDARIYYPRFIRIVEVNKK